MNSQNKGLVSVTPFYNDEDEAELCDTDGGEVFPTGNNELCNSIADMIEDHGITGSSFHQSSSVMNHNESKSIMPNSSGVSSCGQTGNLLHMESEVQSQFPNKKSAISAGMGVHIHERRRRSLRVEHVLNNYGKASVNSDGGKDDMSKNKNKSDSHVSQLSQGCISASELSKENPTGSYRKHSSDSGSMEFLTVSYTVDANESIGSSVVGKLIDGHSKTVLRHGPGGEEQQKVKSVEVDDTPKKEEEDSELLLEDVSTPILAGLLPGGNHEQQMNFAQAVDEGASSPDQEVESNKRSHGVSVFGTPLHTTMQSMRDALLSSEGDCRHSPEGHNPAPHLERVVGRIESNQHGEHYYGLSPAILYNSLTTAPPLPREETGTFPTTISLTPAENHGGEIMKQLSLALTDEGRGSARLTAKLPGAFVSSPHSRNSVGPPSHLFPPSSAAGRDNRSSVSSIFSSRSDPSDDVRDSTKVPPIGIIHSDTDSGPRTSHSHLSTRVMTNTHQFVLSIPNDPDCEEHRCENPLFNLHSPSLISPAVHRASSSCCTDSMSEKMKRSPYPCSDLGSCSTSGANDVVFHSTKKTNPYRLFYGYGTNTEGDGETQKTYSRRKEGSFFFVCPTQSPSSATSTSNHFSFPSAPIMTAALPQNVNTTCETPPDTEHPRRVHRAHPPLSPISTHFQCDEIEHHKKTDGLGKKGMPYVDDPLSRRSSFLCYSRDKRVSDDVAHTTPSHGRGSEFSASIKSLCPDEEEVPFPNNDTTSPVSYNEEIVARENEDCLRSSSSSKGCGHHHKGKPYNHHHHHHHRRFSKGEKLRTHREREEFVQEDSAHYAGTTKMGKSKDNLLNLTRVVRKTDCARTTRECVLSSTKSSICVRKETLTPPSDPAIPLDSPPLDLVSFDASRHRKAKAPYTEGNNNPHHGESQEHDQQSRGNEKRRTSSMVTNERLLRRRSPRHVGYVKEDGGTESLPDWNSQEEIPSQEQTKTNQPGRREGETLLDLQRRRKSSSHTLNGGSISNWLCCSPSVSSQQFHGAALSTPIIVSFQRSSHFRSSSTSSSSSCSSIYRSTSSCSFSFEVADGNGTSQGPLLALNSPSQEGVMVSENRSPLSTVMMPSFSAYEGVEVMPSENKFFVIHPVVASATPQRFPSSISPNPADNSHGARVVVVNQGVRDPVGLWNDMPPALRSKSCGSESHQENVHRCTLLASSTPYSRSMSMMCIEEQYQQESVTFRQGKKKS